MNVRCLWDDTDETIVRWEFDGFVGLVNYMIAVNETAAMGIQKGGKANTIVNMGYKLPLPNRRLSELKKPLLSARWYGLGYVIVVAHNPIARMIIQQAFLRDAEMKDALSVVSSLSSARSLIATIQSDPNKHSAMKMS